MRRTGVGQDRYDRHVNALKSGCPKIKKCGEEPEVINIITDIDRMMKPCGRIC
jgi:hypothetical protein